MKLEVKDLCFSYPKKETIKNICFEAHDQDIVAIIGINGVGKSTMLKCLNRLHKPSNGQVLLDGEDVLKMKTKDVAKKIGYVAQYGQFIQGSVFENVLIGRKPFIKWDLIKDDLEKVDQVLNMVGLSELSDRNIDKLSGGERQKVAIARALAQETPLLMFDEPTSNLDLKNQLEVLNVIQDIVKKNNYIALISIHDVNLALRFANKFLLLKQGTVYGFGDESIITEQSMKDIFDITCKIKDDDGQKVIIVER